MAQVPTRARIRSYNVGFGDCFLLTFSYERGAARHVLIDFGSTRAPGRRPWSLLRVAQQIRDDCGGKLHMVVASHRHADHISGFGGKSGKMIADLQPELVLQPWTEDPDLAPDSKGPSVSAARGSRSRALVSRLADMQSVASAAAAMRMPETTTGIPKTLAAQIRFLGETNIKNEAAVRNLMTMGKRRVYASFGTRLPIASVLPGVRIDVLGPPTLRQSSAIAGEARTDADEFWHLAARRAAAAAAGKGDRASIFPLARTASQFPQEARWVIPHIDRMRAEELLAIVRSLDEALNNTSLILLIEIGDSTLLFPGDAQIEDWRYALFEAEGANEIRKRLARARLYKVGHHASLNATPKTLWQGFAGKRDAPGGDRLVTMVSTLAGKHGSESRGTEVPRKILLDELKGHSDFHNTQTIKSAKTFWLDVDLGL
jgi:hypothetical protein